MFGLYVQPFAETTEDEREIPKLEGILLLIILKKLTTKYLDADAAMPTLIQNSKSLTIN
jgi:hypothetical protein